MSMKENRLISTYPVMSWLNSYLVFYIFTRSCVLKKTSTQYICQIGKKVKFSHSRYQALGQELIYTGSQPAGDSLSHPGGRLPLLLLFTRPAVAFPVKKRHRLLTGMKLYCLVTETHRCELAQGCYAGAPNENRTHNLMIASPTRYRIVTAPPVVR